MKTKASLLAVLLALGGIATANENKNCAVLLLHDRGASTAAVAPLGRKLQPACTARAVEMPWSQRRNNDKDLPGAWQELGGHVKELRRQGFQRVLVGGTGFGANAAMAFLAAVGDTDGVIVVAPEADAPSLGPLPATAAAMRQHAPALWVLGTDDPLHQRGEAFAFAKAPPHPNSRFVSVKADRKGTPDAAVKPVLEWLKSLE